ncbi:MAG: ADP-heptose--LPS heptosyltransferase RfaF [Acidobacteriota bacterium]|nr:MAG: ADP-heptose--LPS heptosyltransferase RfaF [Acidobacteriota bacterium]
MNVDFQRKMDRIVGAPLCRFLSLLPRARRRAADAPPPKKILVILLSEMGSLVLAQPMFRSVRARYPEASIYALVFQQNKEVLDILDEVPEGNVLTIRNTSLKTFVQDGLAALRTLRFIGVDTVIDCELFARAGALMSFLSGAEVRVGFERHTQEGLYRGSFINRPVLYNPYQHIAQQFVTLAAAIDGKGSPKVKRRVVDRALTLSSMSVRDGELDATRSHLEMSFPRTKGKRLVLVYPGGGLLPIRAWPLASFKTLASQLIGEGFVVGILGLAQDKPLARAIQDDIAEGERGNCIDLTGYTKTVRELMLLFHLAELLVTNDGGPAHFASMTPMPSIILFGPETPSLYGSLDHRSVHFFQGLSCSPCLTAYNHRNSPCDGDNQCLKTIAPEEVYAAARRILSSVHP